MKICITCAGGKVRQVCADKTLVTVEIVDFDDFKNEKGEFDEEASRKEIDRIAQEYPNEIWS